MSILRSLVRSSYDIQALRIQTGQRIVSNFKVKLGQAPSKPEAELGKEAKKILADLRVSYERITDGAKNFPKIKHFKADGIITDYTELCLIRQYFNLLKEEEEHFDQLGQVLTTFPLYVKFLSTVRGIGPALAGVILSEFDIKDYCKHGEYGWRCAETDPGAVHHKVYVSSLWKYAGMSVMSDGLGQSRRKEHMVDAFYRDGKGKVQTKKSIGYNPWLKTKLLGVLGGCILKAGMRWTPCTDEQFAAAPDYMRAGKLKKNELGVKVETKCLLEILSPYAKIYVNYRHRLEHHPKYRDLTPEEVAKLKADQKEEAAEPEPEDVSTLVAEDDEEEVVTVKAAPGNKGRKGHRHAMANRYMIKMFLIDLYKVWRPLEKQPVYPPYSEAKLGLPPHQDTKAS
jgi:hypothetical protein